VIYKPNSTESWKWSIRGVPGKVWAMGQRGEPKKAEWRLVYAERLDADNVQVGETPLTEPALVPTLALFHALPLLGGDTAAQAGWLLGYFEGKVAT